MSINSIQSPYSGTAKATFEDFNMYMRIRRRRKSGLFAYNSRQNEITSEEAIEEPKPSRSFLFLSFFLLQPSRYRSSLQSNTHIISLIAISIREPTFALRVQHLDRRPAMPSLDSLKPSDFMRTILISMLTTLIDPNSIKRSLSAQI